jgi:hypothetical protein
MSNAFFGINAHLASRYGGHDLTGPVKLLRDSGASWVREEIRWDMVRVFDKPANDPTGWNFGRADDVVNAEVGADLRVLGLLGYNIEQFHLFGQPDWHQPNLDDWARYVHQMVTHFKGRIFAWEIWNEPNNQPAFWQDDTNPNDPTQLQRRIDNYIRLLRVSFATIRDADPTAEVVSAGCSNVNPEEWLDIFHAGGGTDFCDVVGVHPYIPRQSLETGRFRDHDLTRLKTFQDNIGGKSLWFTELGWSSAIPRPLHEDDLDCVGTEDAQADFLARQYTEILASGIALGPIFWYDLHEDPVDPHNPNDGFALREHHFGMLRLNPNDPNDWTQTKPVYDRFKQLAIR